MTERFPGNGGEQLSEAELFNKATSAYEENFDRIVRLLIGEEVASNAVWKKELGYEALANISDNPDLLDTFLEREYDENAEDPDIAAFDQATINVETVLARIPDQYEYDGFRIRNVQFVEGEGGRVSLGRQVSDHRYWQAIILESAPESVRVTKNNLPISMPGDAFENIIPPEIPDINTADVIEGVNRASALMQEWLALDDEQLRRRIQE